MAKLQAASLFLVFAISVALFSVWNDQVPEAYMDEEFHFPLTKLWCENGVGAWNNKISTGPGMYYYVTTLCQIMKELPIELPFQVCSLAVFRFFMLPISILSIPMYSRIMKHTTKRENESEMEAFRLWLLPFLFFYQFMYYNEIPSTFFVCLMYLSTLEEHFLLSSIFGFIAISIRQTNFIWLLFSICIVLEKEIETNSKGKRGDGPVTSLLSFLCHSFSLPLYVYVRFSPFLCVIGYCIFFVVNNGSIAMGDHGAHGLVFHWAQPFYFMLLFCTMYPLRSIVATFHMIKMKASFYSFLLLLVTNSLVIAILLHYYTYEHIYLISDNRHYMFYIWKLAGGKNIFRLVLAPVYAFSGCLLFQYYFSDQSILWRIFFFICTCASLVPSELLEFRYFIVPLVFSSLHMKRPKNRPYMILMSEVISFLVLNIILFVVFVFYPKENSDGQLIRFMW